MTIQAIGTKSHLTGSSTAVIKRTSEQNYNHSRLAVQCPHRMYVSTGIFGASTRPVLTSTQLTTEQNTMCTAVRVSGNGKPPMFGSSMYLLSLHHGANDSAVLFCTACWT